MRMPQSKSVAIKGGDLILSDGVKFHIKHSNDGTFVYYCEGDGRTYREEDSVFYERLRQRGGFILEPGNGKFDNQYEWDRRERSTHIIDN